MTILITALALGWLVHEFQTKDAVVAISSLNTYNFLFVMLGLLLHWRPRSFLDAVARAVPSTTGVLIQFPLYGGMAAILTTAKVRAVTRSPTSCRPCSCTWPRPTLMPS